MRRHTDKSLKGSETRRQRTARRLPIAAIAALATVGLAGLALGAQTHGQLAPLKPTISGHPSSLTSRRTARFVYVDKQSGVSFQCRLDGAAYKSCPHAAFTYTGLAAGRHTFRVRAAAGSKTSAADVVSWTVDTTPPGVALVDPPNGALVRADAWGQGCPQGAGLCGTAQDSSGVRAVSISIQREDGRWWGGSGFDQTSERFLSAKLTNGHTASSQAGWSYALPAPGSGRYTVHVRATDRLGNTTTPAKQLGATFTVQATTPPASSVLGSREEKPAGTSEEKPAGAVEEKPAGTTGETPAAAKPFTVAGDVIAPLAPGVSRELLVTIANPNSEAITVTSLNVAVAAGSSNAGCDGPSNLSVSQSDLSTTNTLSVPAGGQVTLPSGSVHAPVVLMRDLPTNQDACKNASFTFNYSGSAHS
jgi:hypothetical protein